MSINIVSQNASNVKREIIELADHCLAEHNDQWALWLATGSHEAFLAALAAKQDREALLLQIRGTS